MSRSMSPSIRVAAVERAAGGPVRLGGPGKGRCPGRFTAAARGRGAGVLLTWVAALTALLLWPAGARAQGVIANGTTNDASIATPGETDSWTFTASAGDAIVVRAGQVTDPSGNFEPQVRLLDPGNVQVGINTGDLAAEVAVTAASSGTFTIVVSDGNLAHAGDSTNNTGDYRLHLAKSPGTFTTSAGDEGGDLANGATLSGTIHVGDLDLWSFTASAGDGIIVRAGEVTDDGNFEPQVRLYGPTGALLGTNTGDLAAEVAVAATASGSYTVVVSDGNLAHAADSIGNTGTYRLHLAKSPGAFTTSAGDEGGPLANGATQPGTIHVGDLDLWSFDAAAGDSIVVRVGEVTDDGNFEPQMRLFGPTGAQLGASTGDLAAEIAVSAATSGTFTVVVSDGNLAHSGDSYGNTGTYRLHLAHAPGGFVVPDGDEGGDLLNGATHTGTIHMGDLDLWSFSAEAGDGIVVRVGQITDDGNFEPQVRLYGPTGAQIGATGTGDLAAEVAVAATASGTYTVVVSDGNLAHAADSIGNTGTYRLHLARSPGAFVVSTGDQGGGIAPGTPVSGAIHVGDLDLWRFCAANGNSIAVHIGEVSDDGNFEPQIRLYAPSGTLLRTAQGDASADIAVTAAETGSYTLVVSDANLAHSGDSLGNTGTYQVTVTGIAGCSPACVAPTDDLVSWWRGDGDASDARDGNDGVLQNGAGFGSGKVGLGFSLDGVDDAVSIPDSGNLNLIGSFTWDAWIAPSSVSQAPIIMSKEVSSATRVVLEILATGVLCGRFDDAVNPGSITCSADPVVPTGQFSHVAMVLDGAADELRLYVNSVRVAARSDVGHPFSNTAPLLLGKSSSEGRWFAGIIDEADVFSRALTQDEIRSIYDAGGAGKCRGCLVPCDDGNVCTNDSCDQVSGLCVHTNNTLPCNDQNACTQTDVCSQGVCTGSNPKVCTASDACHTAGTCNPATGVCSNPNAADGAPCSDGNTCTGPDTCQAGVCTGGPNVCGCQSNADCADTNPCTTDTCQNPGTPGAACVHTNNTAPCGDGLYCNGTDTCSGGVCGHSGDPCAGGPVCNNACNEATDTCFNPSTTACASDGNVCTDDRCDGAGACVHPGNTLPCDDGNACTRADSCAGGVCTGSNPVVCAASDQCHDAGTCNPATGICSNPAKEDGSPCNDGNACTGPDVCTGGACGGPSSCLCQTNADCDDGNPCTNDACQSPGTPGATCVHTNNAASCNDGNACTETDVCSDGVCTGTNPVECAAGDSCHDAGTCNPSTGVCSNAAKQDGTSCDDGNECTTGESCQAGVCTGGASACAEDLAIIGLKAPRTITLTRAEPALTKKVVVKVQNRGPRTIRIPSREALAALVTVEVESLGSVCPSPQAVLVSGPSNAVPRKLRSKEKMNVFFKVRFDCANDPLKSRASDPDHDDFNFTAAVHREALDGIADAHPADDLCPREPLGRDPNPDGSIVDKGCGRVRPDGTHGDPVRTDVVR